MDSTIAEIPGLRLAIIPLFVALVGLCMYSVWRRHSLGSSLGSSEALRLDPSFESGLWGGMLGGVFGGVLAGAVQYLHVTSIPDFATHYKTQRDVLIGVFLPTLVCVALGGAIVGAGVQGGILLIRRARVNHRLPVGLFNDVSGGAVGGLLAGVFAGGYIGWFLGNVRATTMEPWLLLASAVLALGGVVFGSLVYTYRGSVLRLLRVVLLTTLVALFCALPLQLVFTQEAINWYFLGETVSSIGPDARYMLGGMLFGASIGAIIGFQAGLTFLIYGAWNAIQTAPDEAIAATWSKRLRRGLVALAVLVASPGLLEMVPGGKSGSTSKWLTIIGAVVALVFSSRAVDVQITRDGLTIGRRKGS